MALQNDTILVFFYSLIYNLNTCYYVIPYTDNKEHKIILCRYTETEVTKQISCWEAVSVIVMRFFFMLPIIMLSC